MLKFKCKLRNRKDLVKRISELTRKPPYYAGAPTFAYQIGRCVVERDGTLSVNKEYEDMAIIEALLNEGMIEAFPEDQAQWQAQDAANSSASAGPAISIPLEGHTGASLRNLLNLIHTRGPLLSKATGGDIGINKELLEVIDMVETPECADDFALMVKRYEARFGGVRGIRFLEDRIVFTGFGDAEDEAHLRAYTELAERLNRMALTQKRIQAKTVNDENPRYAMHIFLIRLGFTGPDFKLERKILMERLEGSQAFRTPEQAEKARVKAMRKRDGQPTEQL